MQRVRTSKSKVKTQTCSKFGCVIHGVGCTVKQGDIYKVGHLPSIAGVRAIHAPENKPKITANDTAGEVFHGYHGQHKYPGSNGERGSEIECSKFMCNPGGYCSARSCKVYMDIKVLGNTK